MGVVQQVIFKLDVEEYGLDIMKVYVIEKYQDITRVPNTSEYIEGIINLRGEILPIYSLRKKFNLTDKPIDKNTKIIVAYANNMKVGFIVDSVTEIIRINDTDVEVAPKIVTTLNTRYIQAVAKLENRMVILIDIDKIISEEEQISLDKIIEEHN